jgi:cytochrome P450
MRHGVTEQESISEVILTLVAGSDTSAIVIRCTLLYIMSTPRVYARLKAELRDAIRSGAAPAAASEGVVISVAQAKRLPYLEAVIREGMRMRPPVTYGHFKQVSPGGDTLGGVWVPEGTAVGHNMVALMRRKSVFGADVDVFRPERFADEPDAARLAEMERAVDLNFGVGRWMCAGRQVAMTELHKVFFEVSSGRLFSRVLFCRARPPNTP